MTDINYAFAKTHFREKSVVIPLFQNVLSIILYLNDHNGNLKQFDKTYRWALFSVRFYLEKWLLVRSFLEKAVKERTKSLVFPCQ